MPTAKQAIGLIIPLFIFAIMASFLFPIAIGAMSGPEEATYNQTVSEQVELQPGMNVTLDSVTAGTSATYTVQAGGDSATATVNVGANSTVTVDGAEVTISPTEVTSTYAVTDYQYPTDYGWGPAASSLWVILPLMLVLALFLYITYRATSTM